MATPKTDIEQSVGRILREKHSQPIVVDIIDSHVVFQRQWLKRKAFYIKEKYKIVYTTNKNYGLTSCWETIHEEGVKCKKKISLDEPLEGKCFLKIK
jgi:hypothetical protein